MYRIPLRFSQLTFRVKRGFTNSSINKSATGASPHQQPPALKYILTFVGASVSILCAAGLNNVYNLFVETSVAKKYVTNEDLQEFKTLNRNVLAQPEGFHSSEFRESNVQIEKKVISLYEQRKALATAQAHEERIASAKTEVNNLIYATVLGSDLERNRVWNDYFSFYCTDKEVEVIREMRAQGREWGSKAAKDSNK